MLEKEFEYFKENKAKLLVKYNGKIIVIKGKKVVGVYENEKEALTKALKDHKLGTFLVQEISEKAYLDVLRFYSRVFITVPN